MRFITRGDCRIHVWGGLGSQLLAVALYMDLVGRFPRKKFNLVFHTGGVTRRSVEVGSLFPELGWQIEDDFVDQNIKKSASFTHKIRHSVDSQILLFLSFIGIFSRSNSDRDYRRLKRRVRIIRGHYSYRALTLDTVFRIRERIDNSYIRSSQFDPNSLAIHYRMGDLLHLEEKSPITDRRVGEEISYVLDNFSISKIIIYSDSPKLAAETLKPFTRNIPTEVKDCSAVQILGEADLSKYFIGTSSKISFWSIFFRSCNNQNCRSSVPEGNSMNLIRTLGIDNQYTDLRGY